MTTYTISLHDAQTRITDWQSDQTTLQSALSGQPSLSSLPPLTIHALTFQLENLTDMFRRIAANNSLHPTGSMNINAVRFYLGNGTDASGNACLIAVGVSGFNQALGVGGVDIIELPAGQVGETSGIYDFSAPCPPTCPSPNGGILDQ
jgi:hypothetical protein